jgi:hypothetical protein
MTDPTKPKRLTQRVDYLDNDWHLKALSALVPFVRYQGISYSSLPVGKLPTIISCIFC